MALIVFFFLLGIFSISLGETNFCSEGWSFFNGNCYKAILPKTGLTFDEASNQCQQVGCELASIHSKAENDFIIDLIHKESVKVKPCYYFWLGLKLKNKIPKIWTDGTTVDFGKTDMTPWDKGEPNNANPQENCVVMYGYSEALGKWNDLSCDKVDEWEAISGMVCKTVAT